ncbi:MAG: CBS domain-containing protein [Bryobacteraceae bacterium]|nr:CBS domain-containing protein [Bryobacteraceae bacterium]
MSAGSVRSILERKGHQIWSIPPTASVFEAIALMDDRQVGALMVVSDGELVGVISERDYARKVILRGRSSSNTPVGEIMTSTVITVTPENDVGECLRMMTVHRIRHLPVLEGRRVVGVVSIGDLVNSLMSAQADIVRQLSDYIAGKYPA